MPEPIPAFDSPNTAMFFAPQRSNRLIGYLGDVRDWHGYVKFLSLAALRETSQDVPLEKLFVEPHVAPQHLSPDVFEAQAPTTQALTAALLEHPRLVLLGDPGSGKSTIVNYLCTALSRGVDSSLTFMFGGPLIPLPFILRELGLGSNFAALPDAAAKWTELLRLFVLRPVATQLRSDATETDGLLPQLLKMGQALVLLDGIDEIGSLEVRRALRDAVHEGMRRYPRARWVLTSRIVGYEEVEFEIQRLDLDHKTVEVWQDEDGQEVLKAVNSLGEEFTRRGGRIGAKAVAELLRANPSARFSGNVEIFPLLYLAPFNNDQVEHFTRLWWAHHESNPHLAGTKPALFLSSLRLSSGASSLARLPHLLTMIALIYRVIAQLPDGRAKLYGLIAETYLGTLDKERGLEHLRPIPADVDEMTRWLAAIAWHLQRRRHEGKGSGDKKDEAQREVLLEHRELLNLLVTLIQPKPPAKPDETPLTVHETARLFLDYAGRRSGLLLPRGDGLYAFLHLSFQEYFASLYLRDQVSDPEWWLEEDAGAPGARLADLRAYADDPLWRETPIFLWENAALINPKLPERLLVRLLGWQRDPAQWGQFPLPTAKELKDDDWTPPQRLVLLAALSVNPHVVLEPAATRRAFQQRCVRWQIRLGEVAGKVGVWDEKWNQPIRQLLSRPASAQPMLALVAEVAAEEKAECLYLNGCTGVSDLTPLGCLTALQGLELNGCTGVSDLAPLGCLTALYWLDLNGCTGVSDLTPLGSLTALCWLDLNGCTGVSDLAPLGSLTTLEHLELNGCTGVRDLIPLGCLTALEHLELKGCTGVSDLTPLGCLTALEHLELKGCTGVSDLTPLGSLTGLRWLELNGCTGVSDLTSLSSLTGLRWLDLRGCTGVSDLTPLGSLIVLEYLDLEDCASLRELIPLGTLAALQSLFLGGCIGVTEEAVAELRWALPKAAIYR